jgi:hypothetical protein
MHVTFKFREFGAAASNISSKGQHKEKELKYIQSKSVILMMRLNFSYMDRLYAQLG